MSSAPTPWSLDAAVGAFERGFPEEPRNMYWKAPAILEAATSPAVAAEVLEFVPPNSNEVGLHFALNKLATRLPPELADHVAQVFAARVGTVGLQAYAYAPAHDARLIVLSADLPMAITLYGLLLRRTYHVINSTQGAQPTSVGDVVRLALTQLPSLLDDVAVSRVLRDRATWRQHGIDLDDELVAIVTRAESDRAADGRSAIGLLRDMGEQFVLAHELSHHLLGHTHDRSFGFRMHQARSLLLDLRHRLSFPVADGEWTDAQLDEFDADALAFFIVAGELRQPNQLDLSLWTEATFGALGTAAWFGDT